jgi:hypothetical protein
VGRPVLADDAAAVHGEDHAQPFDADIVQDLVVGALQEGGIDCHHRPEPLCSEPGRKRDGVLFGNADIEEPLGIGLGELGQTGALGHGGSHGHDAPVFGTQFQQGLAEDLRIGGC